jgi:hypothetical protein
MQPYQAAAEKQRENTEFPLRTLAKGAKVAGSALIASKVLPFLSPYIPENLAIKGLSKIDSRLGKFATAAMTAGANWDETKEFIRGKVTGEEEPTQENRSIIEQYSPELFSFLKDQVSNGRNPLEAGAIAQNNDKFKGVIKKLENDHKTNWSSILQSVFGSGQEAQPEQQQAPQGQPQAQGGVDPQLAQLIGQGNQMLQNYMAKRQG